MKDRDIAADVLAYFRAISSIPRGSGNEARICEWIEDFGKTLGFPTIHDRYNNAVIFKAGQNGGECASPLILQAHSDMVCEKRDASGHDFSKDSIGVLEKDGWIFADGTTLGADNGLGVAFICMILANESLRHPPIEAVVTAGEEIGMIGMSAFDASCLRARRMINLDAEENGVLIAACAGGARSEMSLPVIRCEPKDGSKLYSVKLSGFAGGHSGVDIRKGTGNAILSAGQAAAVLLEEEEIELCGISAGAAVNVIPNRAEFTFYADPAKLGRIESVLDRLRLALVRELPSADGAMIFEMSGREGDVLPFTRETTENILRCVALLPYGAMSFHENLPGQVSLSSNPGVIKTDEETVIIQSLTRGDVNSALERVVGKLRALSSLGKGRFHVTSGYDAWEYAPESPLRRLALQSYRRRYDADMAVSSIHGGLECALMAGKISGLDMISLGPTLFGVHTPNERFEVQTAAAFWEYLAGLLAEY
ncbi:MAG: beta-Ala-His dipeptidase [Synergistaceae bacterium]|jgi:dipeptidase D|nr:beta-Ala-His dipeptidase [Synergistaceae bacterium]